MAVKSQITGIIELTKLKERLGSFDKEVRVFAQNVLNNPRYKDILISYNLFNLDHGIRPDGTQIEKTPTGRQKSTRYERYTKHLKEKRGDIADVVTLEGETKKFRSRIEVKIGADTIYFIDRDEKAEMLESIWGQVLGITEDQLFEFTDIILPEFEKFCERYFKD